ncbi:MAG: hypothetical protein EBS05_08325 [Proteobacteria bacterium]|nr:hypothetical protein [Pseudomonadota bacterium]
MASECLNRRVCRPSGAKLKQLAQLLTQPVRLRPRQLDGAVPGVNCQLVVGYQHHRHRTNPAKTDGLKIR